MPLARTHDHIQRHLYLGRHPQAHAPYVPASNPTAVHVFVVPVHSGGTIPDVMLAPTTPTLAQTSGLLLPFIFAAALVLVLIRALLHHLPRSWSTQGDALSQLQSVWSTGSGAESNVPGNADILPRRAALQVGVSLPLFHSLVCPATSEAYSTVTQDIVVPMILFRGTYCCEYAVQGGQTVKALLDTGSPFLIFNSKEYNVNGRRSRCPPSYELYSSQEGMVEWMEGAVTLDAWRFQEGVGWLTSPVAFSKVVYGAFQTYVDKGGAAQVLFGMVRNRQPDIRTTFMGQTNLRSFTLDFRRKLLILSPRSLVATPRNAVPLVDLRTFWKAPVQQYVCRLDGMVVNGQAVRAPGPIFAIIDTGSTGMFINEEFFFPLQRQARGFSSIDVSIRTADDQLIKLSASRADPQFLVLPTSFPWLPRDGTYLLVLGLCFFRQHALTIDMLSSLMVLTPNAVPVEPPRPEVYYPARYNQQPREL
uniref:Peptidase A1 domain-containing protein n=1 Tax=Eutreptiella gymnastica TaxID=73025 RepID=A0A7S1NV54_9EUGL